MRLDILVVIGLLAAAVIGVGAARAQISDDVVRIGVLNDQSNVYADFGGPGAVVAARMAVEDFGGKVLGKPIDIIVADHQSKADIGAAIARQWFDADKVDMVIGFDNSSVALAVEQVAFQKNRIAIAGAIGTTAFTGKRLHAQRSRMGLRCLRTHQYTCAISGRKRRGHLVLHHRRLYAWSFFGG